jgi:hypothetical protein
MRAVLFLTALLLVGCEDTYRYPCQDPANWKNPECNKPACEVDGFCWDKLSGVEAKPVIETVQEPVNEPVQVKETQPQIEEVTGE